MKAGVNGVTFDGFNLTQFITLVFLYDIVLKWETVWSDVIVDR